MCSRAGVRVGLAAAAITLMIAPAAAAKGREKLEMYTLRGSAATIGELTAGVELAGVRRTASGLRAEAVLTRDQRAKLAAAGVKVRLTRNAKGQTVTEQAAAQAAAGFDVWRSWDEPGGIRDELYDVARRNPQLVKLEVLGTTHQGRELIALKLTQGARDEVDGSRPSVLYSSNQHAREWISLEVNRRLLHHFIARWRANDRAIRRLVKDTELWFVISANPDGYQYTFDTERLWRKNLRDNNGDGNDHRRRRRRPEPQLRLALGLRQRGLVARSGRRDLPRPQRRVGARDPGDAGLDRPHQAEVPVEPALLRPVAAVSAGLAGGDARRGLPDLRGARRHCDAESAIPGFNPGQSADTLYVTNGETTDYADTTAGTVSYTPELGEGLAGIGLRVPRRRGADPGGVREDARLPHGPGAVRGASGEPGLAGRASTSSRSTSTPTTSTRRTARRRCSTSSSRSPTATRRRCACSPSAASARSRCTTSVDGGAVQSEPTSEWSGGERYGPGNGAYYHVVRGEVTGAQPGRRRRGVVQRRRRDAATRSPTGSSPTAAGAC